MYNTNWRNQTTFDWQLMENASNDLSPKLVIFVMKKYYRGYLPKYYEDLYSYGLEALYDADRVYDPKKNTKPFKYFATCLIRRAMFMFVRDRITKTYQKTTFIDDNSVLEVLGKTYQYQIGKIDLYRAIKTLSDEEKNILYLLYEKEHTLYQIGDLYKCSHQTVFIKHKRILTKLKELLKNYEP